MSAAGGLVGKLWKVKGGNFQLPIKVLEFSKATLVKSKVILLIFIYKNYAL